ncbi:hypothetical protein PIB30_096781, partial [Stylosanthes scabra]|nr:hypothetical protein [Stylosanthes scabra]
FQIHQRKWEKFTKPIQAVGHLMVKEFYANAWEPDKVRRKQRTYTSMRERNGSIIIGENINVEEIIAEQIYKFIYKTDISSSLPFPSIIAALCADAKIPAIPDDTLIPQEPPIIAEAMVRTREPRAKNPRQTRQTTPPQQQPQVQHQQELPAGFYTHFDTAMSQIHTKLDQHQEENRRSFEAINTRMDQMDDQLSFLCYSN